MYNQRMFGRSNFYTFVILLLLSLQVTSSFADCFTCRFSCIADNLSDSCREADPGNVGQASGFSEQGESSSRTVPSEQDCRKNGICTSCLGVYIDPAPAKVHPGGAGRLPGIRKTTILLQEPTETLFKPPQA